MYNVNKNNCHTGNILVFETEDGIKVYGGGSSRNGCWYRMTPQPDLAIGPSDVVLRYSPHNIPDGWVTSDRYEKTETVIVSINWPDYNIPTSFDKRDWYNLVQDIYDNDVKTVSCQCVGGHGRTGVQLAILAHLLIPDNKKEWKDSAELIMWVRERMCVHEVETEKQQQYVADMCDLPLGESLFPSVIPHKYNTGFWVDEFKESVWDKEEKSKGYFTCVGCNDYVSIEDKGEYLCFLCEEEEGFYIKK